MNKPGMTGQTEQVWKNQVKLKILKLHIVKTCDLQRRGIALAKVNILMDTRKTTRITFNIFDRNRDIEESSSEVVQKGGPGFLKGWDIVCHGGC